MLRSFFPGALRTRSAQLGFPIHIHHYKHIFAPGIEPHPVYSHSYPIFAILNISMVRVEIHAQTNPIPSLKCRTVVTKIAICKYISAGSIETQRLGIPPLDVPSRVSEVEFAKPIIRLGLLCILKVKVVTASGRAGKEEM